MSVERAKFEVQARTPPGWAEAEEEVEDPAGTIRRRPPPPACEEPWEDPTQPRKEETTRERPAEPMEGNRQSGRRGAEEADGRMEGDGIGERVPPAGVGGRREKAAAGEPGEERAAAGEPGEKSGERPGVGDPRPEPARGGIEEEATTRGRPEEGPRAEEPEPAGWNPGAARRDIEALVRQVVEQRERQAPQRQAPQRKAAPEKAAGMAGLAAGIESRLRHLEERLRVNRDGG